MASNEHTAKLTMCLSSPRKMRLVADSIRGKSLSEAKAILSALPNRASTIMLGVVNSAAANLEDFGVTHGEDYDVADFWIFEVTVDEGPKLKRWRARSRGLVNKYSKKTCHIKVRMLADYEAYSEYKAKQANYTKKSGAPRMRKYGKSAAVAATGGGNK
ncbi:MAG: 50S ribosomal protein L22 [Planctomycetes bacterium]|nr:50S ribosomal protein L22 [Planctomycetota bacterium]